MVKTSYKECKDALCNYVHATYKDAPEKLLDIEGVAELVYTNKFDEIEEFVKEEKRLDEVMVWPTD